MLGISKIRNYIEDHEVHLDLFKNRVHVSNYDKILSLGEEKIVLIMDSKKVVLTGKGFSLNQMLEDELLIEGVLLKVEIEP